MLKLDDVFDNWSYSYASLWLLPVLKWYHIHPVLKPICLWVQPSFYFFHFTQTGELMWQFFFNLLFHFWSADTLKALNFLSICKTMTILWTCGALVVCLLEWWVSSLTSTFLILHIICRVCKYTCPPQNCGLVHYGLLLYELTWLACHCSMYMY